MSDVHYQCYFCGDPVPEPMVCSKPECTAQAKRHAPSCRCSWCITGGETRSLSWTGCTCPFSEKDPDAMCGPGCRCLACHPERSVAAAKADALHPTGRCSCGGEGTCDWCREQAQPKLPPGCRCKDLGDSRGCPVHDEPPPRVSHAMARLCIRDIDPDESAIRTTLRRYADQQEGVERRLEIWADAANSLLSAMANGDDEAQRLAYGRVLKLVDGHWPEYSPPQPQVATFVPGSEQGSNPPAAAAGSEGRDGVGPPDPAVVSSAVNAIRIRTLLTGAARQANDGERAKSQAYHRHFTCLAIENVVRAVTLLADRLVPLTPEERRILDSH